MTGLYKKPWKSYSAQLDHLIDRGLVVTDRERALDYLERVGYYRLSGYWFAFRKLSDVCCPLNPSAQKPNKVKEGRIALDEFKTGSSFQNAVDLYVFDKKLRLIILDALERIEIALRVHISHNLGRIDTFAYLKPELFHEKFSSDLDKETGVTAHHKWLDGHARLIQRSKEDFIRHNKEKYGLPLAIWVACEVWDFGTLSTLYSGMKESDQDAISIKFGIRNGRVFATWLRSLNYLRNVCAHHSRLWNRNIVMRPQLPVSGEVPLMDRFHGDDHRSVRPFILICIIHHLLSKCNPTSTWSSRLFNLLNEFPSLDHLGINVQGMGAFEDWRELDWQKQKKNP